MPRAVAAKAAPGPVRKKRVGGVPRTVRTRGAAGGVSPAFRSRSEERAYKGLTERGYAVGFEVDKLEYIEPSTKRAYIPDFTLEDGSYIEVKGFWPPKDRQKMILVLRSNPDATIRVLFDTPDRPITKGSSTTYGMFCTKNGIPWAKGPQVPDEWLAGCMATIPSTSEE